MNQGSNFCGPFISLDSLESRKVEKIEIEGRNGLTICESYQEPIRTIVRKIMVQHPKFELDLVLALKVLYKNDTVGPHGLITSDILFG